MLILIAFVHVIYYKKMLMYLCFFLFPQYIGSRTTDQRADEVSKLGILDFWTPENHYRWSVSRYGGHRSASVESVSRSQLFLCGMFLQTLFCLANNPNTSLVEVIHFTFRFGDWGS